MPHITIHDGRPVYRTKLFAEIERARAFCRCLAANTDRFEGAVVHASHTSKTPKWFVTFEPASDARKDAIHYDLQASRADRASEGEFIFWPDPDRPRLYWCFSVASGETYEISSSGATPTDCSCPDFTFRCSRVADLACKHMLAWRMQCAAGILGKTDKTTPAQDTAAARPRWTPEEYSQHIAEDFC